MTRPRPWRCVRETRRRRHAYTGNRFGYQAGAGVDFLAAIAFFCHHRERQAGFC
jgi:hypothetical protein